MEKGDARHYVPGVSGTKWKSRSGGGGGWVFYPAQRRNCSWETEYERKQREKEEAELERSDTSVGAAAELYMLGKLYSDKDACKEASVVLNKEKEDAR